MKTFPLTALETDKCPPHLWYIPIVKGEDSIGRCTKCPATKNFRKKEKTVAFKEACARGGRIGGGNGRKHKDIWR